MKIFEKCITALVVLNLFVVLLTGCGGGGSSSDPGANTSLSGVASKGLISGATVTVYALNAAGNQGSALATATTGSNGAYSVNLGTYTGSILVVASGGSYTDEATGATVSGADVPVLRAALTGVSGIVKAAVTPLTEIAVQKAGTLTAANVTDANNIVSSMIGGVDIIVTMPADVLVSSSSTTAEKNYGLMLATISQMVSDGTAATVADAISSIVNDLADNQLDTTGADISTALDSFMISTNNNTGLDAATTTLDDTITTVTTNVIMGVWALNGTYAYATQTAGFYQYGTSNAYTASMVYTGTGTIIFNGSGVCSITHTDIGYDMMHTSNTLSEAPDNGSGQDACTYTVDADGNLSVSIGSSVAFTGIVSADGNTIVSGGPYLNGTLRGSDQMMMVKMGTTMSVASLNNTYAYVAQTSGFYEYGTGPIYTASMVSTGTGTITFNGSGVCSITHTDIGYDMMHASNTLSESPSNGSGQDACTYTVSTNGTLTVTIGANVAFIGTVSTDGNTIVSGGPYINGTLRGSDQMMMVKMGSTMSVASLNNTYAYVAQTSGFYEYGTGPVYTASMASTGTGTITFNGSGGCSISHTDTGYDMMHTTNILSPSPSNGSGQDACTYTVDADGNLSVSIGSSVAFIGTVSADGNAIVSGAPYINGTVRASDQMMMVKTTS